MLGDFIALDPAARYDVILALTSLSHIERDTSLRVVLPGLISMLRPGGVLLATVFLDDDPGALGASAASPTAGHVQSYFAQDEFVAALDNRIEILSCEAIRKLDTSHGPTHEHSVLEVQARRR